MKKLTATLVLLTNLFATLAVAEKLPDFVRKEMQFYSKHKAAKKWLTRPLGWGKGIYWAEKGRTVNFIWFAYSNEQGWVQLVLDTRLMLDATLKIESIQDSYQRQWETNLEGNTTWIGATNDWVTHKGNCHFTRGKDILVCDFNRGLMFVLDELNKQSFISFEFRSYLNWPKK